jgi:hypothetical protein
MTNTAPAKLLSHMPDSRNGKLLEERILDRHQEGSETDLSRMIPQLMSLSCCTYLTYGDGDSDEIEYASREVK